MPKGSSISHVARALFLSLLPSLAAFPAVSASCGIFLLHFSTSLSLSLSAGRSLFFPLFSFFRISLFLLKSSSRWTRCWLGLSPPFPFGVICFGAAPRWSGGNSNGGYDSLGVVKLKRRSGEEMEEGEKEMWETLSRQLFQMLGAVALFHASEYILAVRFHGWHNVNGSSLLISKQYLLAMTCALVEYVVEIALFPELKEQWWLSNLGLAMVVIGEFIRKAGVITAGNAFTHKIRIYYEENHKLVTQGIYRFVRHPGYSGFFIWATGTQVMLCNPISVVGFAIVTWCFFSRRIPYEEFFLRQFFGQEYEEYAQKVPSGLPFIK